jgi:hypothetical protein
VFSELPKIFDRNFIVSFFLPAAGFVLSGLGLMSGFGFSIQWPKGSTTLEATTGIGVASLVVGIVMLILNYEIYRLLEGYPLERFTLFKKMELRRFRRERKMLSDLQKQRDVYKAGEVPKSLTAKRTPLMREHAARFPDKEEFVLSTAFGNIIRSFEIYSRVIYGLDAIPAWPRLQAVMTKEYMDIVNEAKAITDLWVNVLVLNFLLLLWYVTLVIYSGRMPFAWVPVVTIGLAAIAYWRAKGAAKGWGETVKAAFDIFIPDLRKKLEFPFPSNLQEERELWLKFGRVMVFRSENLELNRVQSPNQNGPTKSSP